MLENQMGGSNLKKRGGYKKYVLGFLGIFFLVLIFLFLAPRVSSWYGAWKDTQFEAKVQGVRKEMYDAAMADTYGGKTPQETLQMYIAAVEKGDYELASKYLVEEKQKDAFDQLSALKQENNLSWFLGVLKNATSDEQVVEGSFRMKSKTDLGPYYFIRFVQYPSDIWKIVEI